MCNKKILNTFIILTSVFLISSCASAPDGNNILKEMIQKDTSSLKKNSESKNSITKGRPIFIKSYVYPQLIDSGDFYAGGWVYLEVGREKLDLEKMLK